MAMRSRISCRDACDSRRLRHLRRSLWCLPIILFSGTSLAQSPIFTPEPEWSADGRGGTRNRVRFADLDRDGDLDFVSAMHLRGNLFRSIRLSARFERDASWNYPLSGQVTGDRGDLALGDVNRDGYVDIVIGRASDHRAELVLNGPGGPDGAPSWRSSLPHDAFALADFDEDGDLDLICGGSDGGAHAIYLNGWPDAGLSSEPIWTSDTASETPTIAVGDLDGDGDLDLVFGNGDPAAPQTNPNHIFLNQGAAEPPNARFHPLPDWIFSSGARQDLALGDVDGDGDLDLVVVDPSLARIHLNRASEGGSWIPQIFDPWPAWSHSSAGATLRSVALGDVDNDGDLDLALGGGENAASLVFLNDGADPWFDAAVFALPDSGKNTTDIALADVDGDGDLDLMAAYATDAGAYELFLNQSPHVSPVASQPLLQPLASHGLAAADVDGDGVEDLVVAGEEISYLYRATLADGAYSLPLAGEGINRFATAVRAVALVDLDADGDPELVCGNDKKNHVYRNVAGTFEITPGWLSPDSVLTTSLASGDVDGDGRPDLLFGNIAAPNRIFLNSDDPDSLVETTAAWEGAETENTRAVRLADLDGDGDLDAIFGNDGQGNTIYLNDGTTLADTPVWQSDVSMRTTSVAVGDVDGDGYPDVVFGNDGQADNLYLNPNGALGSGANLSADWSSAADDSTRSVALADVDGDGDLDLVCGNAHGGVACYLNEWGEFAGDPSWRTETAANLRDFVLADFDLDGDLDLVCSNGGDVNTMHLGQRHPMLPWDTAQPSHHLPNNPTLLSDVRIVREEGNLFRISLLLRDAESDPVGMILRYRYEGSPEWYPARVDGPLETLATSTAGESHDLMWDVSREPVGPRDVILSIVTIPNPQTYSEIRQRAAVEFAIGPLQVRRPQLVTDPIANFSRVTWGDTVRTSLVIGNAGNFGLIISDVGFTDVPDYFWHEEMLPLSIPPGPPREVFVWFCPRGEVPDSLAITLDTNDPFAGVARIELQTDAVALEFDTILLIEGETAPLGDALSLIVNPRDFVVIERGAISYRQTDDTGPFTAIELVPAGDAFSAVIPGRDVTEAGLEYFVEVENSGVFASDPPDTTGGRFLNLAVSAPTMVTAEPVPTSGTDYLERRAIAVQVSLAEGVIYEGGTLHFRRGGESRYDSIPIVDVEPLPTAIIPDSMVGPRGVEYYAQVTTGTTELSDPPTDPAGHPHAIRVRVADLAEPVNHPGFQYRMVSVPLDFGTDFNGTLEALLSDQPSFGPYPGEPYDLGQWRCFRGLPPDGAPRELPAGPAADFRVVPGRGFWLISRGEHAIATSPVVGASTPTDAPFTVTLAPGWNMIGHPFAFPVAWDAVTVDGQPAGAAAVEGPWSFDGASYVDVTLAANPRLEPFAGYWIRNSAEPAREVVLRIPPQESTSAGQVAQQEEAFSGQDILWQVAITAACAGVQDGANRLGVGASARDTWDALDRHEPPGTPGRSVSLGFPHASWIEQAGRYTADYRAAVTDAGGYAWMFDVAKDFRGEAVGNVVELKFVGLQEVPTEYDVSLLDRELDRIQDLRESARYEFHLGIREPVATEAAARFVLLVGDAEYIDGQLDELSTPPLRTALHQNYPNPFNPETVIRWDVAEAGPVDMKIYDLAGALVRTAHHGLATAGGHEFVWRGDDDHGRRVASGVYIYRLRAGDVVQTKRMMLVK